MLQCFPAPSVWTASIGSLRISVSNHPADQIVATKQYPTECGLCRCKFSSSISSDLDIETMFTNPSLHTTKKPKKDPPVQTGGSFPI